MYLIRSPSGLKLQWFHSTGMMVIETESSSNRLPTMGLCGRWSSSSSYDMMVSDMIADSQLLCIPLELNTLGVKGVRFALSFVHFLMIMHPSLIYP